MIIGAILPSYSHPSQGADTSLRGPHGLTVGVSHWGGRLGQKKSFYGKHGNLSAILDEPLRGSTLAQLIEWHMRNGTRPKDSAGKPWTIAELAEAIDARPRRGSQPATAERNLRNWLEGTFPQSFGPISDVFFGSVSTEPHNSWRKQFYDTWKASRPNVRKVQIPTVSAANPLADSLLKKDDAEPLIKFYSKEQPVAISIGNEIYEIPFVYLVKPTHQGILDNQNFVFELSHDEDEYEPPQSYDRYIRPVVQMAAVPERGHYNGIVLRLATIQYDPCEKVAILQKSRYFFSLATNFAMEHKPSNCSQALRQLIHSEGILQDDVLVNHIGLVCMIESVDGYLVVQERASTGLANRGGTLSSSVSGSLKLDYDIDSRLGKNRYTLSDISRGIVREGVEELGIKLDQVRFLGAMKEMLRGGKPEIYFFARSSLTLHQIIDSHRTQARTKAESYGLQGLDFASMPKSALNPAEYLDGLECRAKAALKRVSGKANMTLVAGILLVFEHVSAELIEAYDLL